MKLLLNTLTDSEIIKIEKRLWKNFRFASGSQPFGFDRPTVAQTDPEYLAALDAIRIVMMQRNLGYPRRSNL